MRRLIIEEPVSRPAKWSPKLAWFALVVTIAILSAHTYTDTYTDAALHSLTGSCYRPSSSSTTGSGVPQTVHSTQFVSDHSAAL